MGCAMLQEVCPSYLNMLLSCYLMLQRAIHAFRWTWQGTVRQGPSSGPQCFTKRRFPEDVQSSLGARAANASERASIGLVGGGRSPRGGRSPGRGRGGSSGTDSGSLVALLL